MKFTKMHGIGNDYVYVDGTKETIENPSETAIKVSDRHFGIGSDGLIIIMPSDAADFEMVMYNADGSRGKMCGNGIRCVAKYVYDHGMTDKKEIAIDTLAGVKYIQVETDEHNKVAAARVDMGEPLLQPSEIPVDLSVQRPFKADRVINEEIRYQDGKSMKGTCVSMGNPHCVIFLEEDVRDMRIEDIGPLFEKNPVFPDRVNTEFVNVLDRGHVRMRVWERGSGETLACGTGACAVAVAAVLNGYTDRHVVVSLSGGDLDIVWDEASGHVFMTGPAATVFEGEIDV
jgi:diaminopimelate epimerase